MISKDVNDNKSISSISTRITSVARTIYKWLWSTYLEIKIAHFDRIAIIICSSFLWKNIESGEQTDLV